MKATSVATLIIALCVALLANAIPAKDVGPALWFFVFVTLVACAFFAWTHPKSPKRPIGWLYWIAAAIGCGTLFAGIDALFFGLESAHVSLDLSLTVLGAIVGLSGFVRSLVDKW